MGTSRGLEERYMAKRHYAFALEMSTICMNCHYVFIYLVCICFFSTSTYIFLLLLLKITCQIKLLDRMSLKEDFPVPGFLPKIGFR